MRFGRFREHLVQHSSSCSLQKKLAFRRAVTFVHLWNVEHTLGHRPRRMHTWNFERVPVCLERTIHHTKHRELNTHYLAK
ncbi:hypothetical protein Y1Q_0017877 [Alligator mississippiensis]|uniref:Uncharacterized protein n=1 Tax=Alligator mississippiensis TaxID=8496 RepID=A0A151PHF9_ALLMI|nr:hypothetical protein Y1Q_0017877 [Alligator mississippiensis]